MKVVEGFVVRTAGWPPSQVVRQSLAEHRHHRRRDRVRSIVLCGLAVIAVGSALGALYLGLWFASAASSSVIAPRFQPASSRDGRLDSLPSDCDAGPSTFRTARIC